MRVRRAASYCHLSLPCALVSGASRIRALSLPVRSKPFEDISTVWRPCFRLRPTLRTYRPGESSIGAHVETDREAAERYERERKESHERHELERKQAREAADRERKRARERREQERRNR